MNMLQSAGLTPEQMEIYKRYIFYGESHFNVKQNILHGQCDFEPEYRDIFKKLCDYSLSNAEHIVIDIPSDATCHKCGIPKKKFTKNGFATVKVQCLDKPRIIKRQQYRCRCGTRIVAQHDKSILADDRTIGNDVIDYIIRKSKSNVSPRDISHTLAAYYHVFMHKENVRYYIKKGA